MIFKEYEALYQSGGWTGNPPESSFLMRVVLPHSTQSMSEQDRVMSKRCEEADAFCQATGIDYTDGGRNADDRKQLQS